ncbi:MAG: hypothetical protein MZU95_01850 [Desulfomicrobium escambiense]|nr:hypothetical protein [Desulfomicrobium escambiense]
MNNKEFREIQVSSTLLVVIFLGVLALGVFIFLLGVSVGKKQVRLVAAPTQVVTQQIPEPVKEPSVKPTAEETESAAVRRPASSSGAPATKTPADGRLQARRRPRPVKAPARRRPTDRPRRRGRRPPRASGTSRSLSLPTTGPRPRPPRTGTRSRDMTVLLLSPQAASTKTWYKRPAGGFYRPGPGRRPHEPS